MLVGMARVSTYLNFVRSTEEAFEFYRSVFGGEFTGAITRFGDLPAQEGMPPLAEADRRLIMHIELPILGGHVLHGTDAPESMGFTLRQGDNVHLNLEPDSYAEGERLFQALSLGGTVQQPLTPMFWGATFGSFKDRYGTNWMVNCPNPSS